MKCVRNILLLLLTVILARRWSVLVTDQPVQWHGSSSTARFHDQEGLSPWLCHCSVSLCCNDHSRWTWVSRYQNVSILDYVGAKDDEGGGDNWSYNMCKAPVKSSPHHQQTNTQFLQAGCPSCCPTNSVKADGVKYVLCFMIRFDTICSFLLSALKH